MGTHRKHTHVSSTVYQATRGRHARNTFALWSPVYSARGAHQKIRSSNKYRLKSKRNAYQTSTRTMSIGVCMTCEEGIQTNPCTHVLNIRVLIIGGAAELVVVESDIL